MDNKTISKLTNKYETPLIVVIKVDGNVFLKLSTDIGAEYPWD